jgi:hypothetical protein
LYLLCISFLLPSFLTSSDIFYLLFRNEYSIFIFFVYIL